MQYVTVLAIIAYCTDMHSCAYYVSHYNTVLYTANIADVTILCVS